MSIGKKITPYYSLDLERVKSNYNKWRVSFSEESRKDILAYSIKANYDKSLIEVLENENAFFEVCSSFEYNYLLSIGVKTDHIIHNGTIKKYEELEYMLNGDSIVILDSERAIDYALRYRKEGKVGLRCNIDQIKMGASQFRIKNSRFGISNIEWALNRLRTNECLKIAYLQAHCAGNDRSPEVYELIAKQLCKILINSKMFNVEYIDVGGGFRIGKNYWNESIYVKSVSGVLRDYGLDDIGVVYEPGNSLVRTAGKYVTKVVDKKIIRDKIYLVVDGSIIHLPFLKKTKIGNNYAVHSKSKELCNQQIVVGCTCKESDELMVLENEYELTIGDEIEIIDVGAYSINEINEYLINKPRMYYE